MATDEPYVQPLDYEGALDPIRGRVAALHAATWSPVDRATGALTNVTPGMKLRYAEAALDCGRDAAALLAEVDRLRGLLDGAGVAYLPDPDGA